MGWYGVLEGKERKETLCMEGHSRNELNRIDGER
jgi:hypothetical protein